MAKRGMKPSHYQQVMGDKSPLARLIKQADQDVQERVKAAREVKTIDGMSNIVARWNARGIIISRKGA